MRCFVIAHPRKRAGLHIGHAVITKKGEGVSRALFVTAAFGTQEQPLVLPQVLHFMQVPLRTRVKLPQAPQLSPSKPFIRASATRLAWRSRASSLEDIATSMLATWALTGLPICASTLARISLRSTSL